MSRGVDGRSDISNLYLSSLLLPTCYLNDITYLPIYYYFELFFFLFFFFPDKLLLRLR